MNQCVVRIRQDECHKAPHFAMNLTLIFLSVTVAAVVAGGRVPRQQDSYRGYSYGGGPALGNRPPQPRRHGGARCSLVPASGHRVVGDILFHQTGPGGPVEVVGIVHGLTPGLHGFHIHKNGNTSDNCKGAGPHFNPENTSHGAPSDQVRHAGDLGNIEADARGSASVAILDAEISLEVDHRRNVVGRAVVVHGEEDDLGRGGNAESLKTGNAGARVACCVIRAADYTGN